MLIIEGSDCVGKTTLSKHLGIQLDLLYQHIGPLPAAWSDADYIWLGSHNVIRDRYHLSELVYSKVLNRNCKIKNPRLLHSTLVLKHRAYTVVITADDDLIRSRYGEKEELFSIDDVLAVNALFMKMNAFWDYHVHCTSQKPYVNNHDIDFIKKAYKEREEFLAQWKDTLRNSM